MKLIQVHINRESGEISVMNDGCSIDLVKHEKSDKLIPELIFTQLYTSSNYNDSEERLTGGVNGVGVKLTNVLSKKFTVEIQRPKQYFSQTCINNLSEIQDYKVESKTVLLDNSIRISFIPDYDRLDMTPNEKNQIISDDDYHMMLTRVYDLACSINNVKLYLNGTCI